VDAESSAREPAAVPRGALSAFEQVTSAICDSAHAGSSGAHGCSGTQTNSTSDAQDRCMERAPRWCGRSTLTACRGKERCTVAELEAGRVDASGRRMCAGVQSMPSRKRSV